MRPSWVAHKKPKSPHSAPNRQLQYYFRWSHAMPSYRACILDDHGHLMGAVDIDCADDEAAKERTELLMQGHDGELWRLVALFKADSPPLPAPDATNILWRQADRCPTKRRRI